MYGQESIFDPFFVALYSGAALLALVLALSLPAFAAAFSDVLGDAWYAGAVSYVSDHGLMTGFGNGRFAPEGTVTRAQMVQILHAAEGKPEARNASFSP